jgi:hypothetical protein
MPTFTSVVIDKKSQKIVEIKVCLTFLLVDGSGSVQNNDGSGSRRPKNILRIHNTAPNYANIAKYFFLTLDFISTPALDPDLHFSRQIPIHATQMTQDPD